MHSYGRDDGGYYPPPQYSSYDYSGLVRPAAPEYPRPGPGSWPDPYWPRKKKNWLAVLVIIFSILAILLMSISLFVPWYSYSMDAYIESDVIGWDMEYSLNGIDVKQNSDSEYNPYSDSFTWDEADELGMNVDNTRKVYETCQILDIIGLIMIIFFMISGIVLLFGKLKIMAIIFGILAIIFCLVIPLYFMANHQVAWHEDNSNFGGDIGSGPGNSFMGSDESDVFEQSWGPTTGWYLTWLSFIFVLIGFIVALFVKAPMLMRPKHGSAPQQQYPSPPPHQLSYPPYPPRYGF